MRTTVVVDGAEGLSVVAPVIWNSFPLAPLYPPSTAAEKIFILHSFMGLGFMCAWHAILPCFNVVSTVL